MTIARWSPRTILWLWIGVLACYAVVMVAGSLKIQRERRAFADSIAMPAASAQGGDRLPTPAQPARRDSLVDSLKRLGESFLYSAEGQRVASGIVGALTRTSREAPRRLAVGFAIFLAPALVMLLITLVWLARRRATLRRAGA